MAQKLSPRAGGGGGDPDAAAKYVPAPSIGHEIGVMFAFMAVMLIGKLSPKPTNLGYCALKLVWALYNGY
ncbi:hypothetical protein M501DRAFT_999599 [Patellaria atrata CBS 101060]|uniref:Uncharacterized protein n=1 Tax=Patellaria atrata CBS 101060 TaxID=1346257 RepID=A0A9P4VL09_9PEZI|nr:hypothetical protein M501DRAFT_999599 [Patellaria atrata CBS 101060]